MFGKSACAYCANIEGEDVRFAEGGYGVVRLDRRAALRVLAGATAFASGWLAAGVRASDASLLPFDRPKGLVTSEKKVLAHWHFFPISFDNRVAGDDYFSREFLGATGVDKRPRPFGPYALERPLPRPPRSGRDWLIDDLEQDVRWADAIGIDAFIFNIITVDPKSDFWLLLPKMLTAAARVRQRLPRHLEPRRLHSQRPGRR